jgi:hypothetical protein
MSRLTPFALVLVLAACDRPPETCVPESDASFCARLGKDCEAVTEADNCGGARTASCGTCAAGQGCVTNVCRTPVCASLTFSTSAPVAGMSTAGIEESIHAATPDGRTIVFSRPSEGALCGRQQVFVADSPDGATFTHREISGLANVTDLHLEQETFTILADGLTLVGRAAADAQKLLATRRSARDLTDFGPTSAAGFEQINAMLSGTSGTLVAPVVSMDGLELFFTVRDLPSDATGLVNGNYHSVRASPSAQFPAGELLAGAAQDYAYVSGVSSDRLALFLTNPFFGSILTRTSTSGVFVNPNAPGPAPTISAGWSHRPLLECDRLVAMYSPGGCANEDVVYVYAP